MRNLYMIYFDVSDKQRLPVLEETLGQLEKNQEVIMSNLEINNIFASSNKARCYPFISKYLLTQYRGWYY